jgi:hypothetical protein
MTTTRARIGAALLASMAGMLCVLAMSGAAQKKPTTPKPGSPERKAIMDALRVPVEKDLKQKVLFKVDTLRVLNGWAFLGGMPLQKNGKNIDYRKTKYRDALEADAFDDSIYALLKKGAKGWSVKAFVIGPTDVAWEGWDKEFGAPRAIFGFPPR